MEREGHVAGERESDLAEVAEAQVWEAVDGQADLRRRVAGLHATVAEQDVVVERVHLQCMGVLK